MAWRSTRGNSSSAASALGTSAWTAATVGIAFAVAGSIASSSARQPAGDGLQLDEGRIERRQRRVHMAEHARALVQNGRGAAERVGDRRALARELAEHRRRSS